MTNPADVLKKPYARVVVPEDDGSFRGEILEFPGCVALGDTAVEALASLESVALSWLEATIANGLPIPAPFEPSEGYSGKLVLRLPRSLHKQAAQFSKREGVSLNSFISSAIAMQIGVRSAADITAQRSNFYVNVMTQNNFGIVSFQDAPVKMPRELAWSSVGTVSAFKDMTHG